MTMANETQAAGQQAPALAELDEFSALLKREFKPKSEEANEAVQRAVRTLARQALPREQHRDRRDAEDPRHERLEGRPRPHLEALQGHGVGPEPALQEDLRGRVRPARRRALRRY